MLKPNNNLYGFLALLGAAFVYALFGVLIRLMAPMFSDGFQVASRLFLAGFFILLFNLYKRNSLKLGKSALVKSLALGIVFSAVILFFTFAVLNTLLANAVFLLYAGSIIIASLIGTLLFKESLKSNKILAIILAIIGIAAYSNAILSLSLGVVAALISGLLDGVQNSLRKLLSNENRNLVLMYSFASGTILALVVSFLSGGPLIKTISVIPIVVLVIFSLFQIVLGYFLLYGFKHFDVNVGVVVLSTELIFASLFGLFLYNEIPTGNELLGGLFIFTAAILTGIEIKPSRKGGKRK